MTAILHAALLAALGAASIPAVAAAQDTSTAGLVRRIESLERANTDLERRVSELESPMETDPPQSPPIPVSTRWQDLANWRRLRLGMGMDTVRALLGEPERVDAGPITFWRWGNANVTFMDDKIAGWSEPRR